MKVQVEDKLFIESDERQFTIKEYSGKFDKDGKEFFKPLGYFSSFTQALKHLVKIGIVRSEATTIQELLSDIERIEKKINQLIKK